MPVHGTVGIPKGGAKVVRVPYPGAWPRCPLATGRPGAAEMSDDAGMALIEASMEGDMAGMQAALDGGADVNYQDPGGQTALHWCALNGHSAAVKWLLGLGPALEAKNEGGQTPLMAAAFRCAGQHPPLLPPHAADA